MKLRPMNADGNYLATSQWLFHMSMWQVGVMLAGCLHAYMHLGEYS